MNCQTCQTQLLDHLYGLLDDPEAAAVDAHLASCPACAAAWAENGRVQGLIARAAKSAFPNTRFEAPAQPAPSGTRTPAPTAPTTLPFPSPTADPDTRPARALRIGTILPWAVAAAVLIAIPGTVVPVLGMFNRAAEAEIASADAKREADLLANNVENVKAGLRHQLSDAEFKLTVAEQARTAILGRWLTEHTAVMEAATENRLTVDVSKPAVLQPGAPNDFLVVVNDRREQWERSGRRMIAEVHAVNASDAVIFTQPLDSERRADKKHALRLPASAWTKVPPDAELFLVVAQVDEKTQARTELLDRVKLAGPVFATLLVTDKAAYRPGDRLFFRSLTLDRVTFRPPGREQVLRYELLQPDGKTPVAGLSVSGATDLVRVGPEGKVEPVRTADGQPLRGVGCGEFVLPPDLPDGEYQLVLKEQSHPGGFPATVPTPVTRGVTVRSAPADHYRKQVGFARGSFAPGETVEAWAELAFQDRPVPNATVLAVTAQVDGGVIDRIEAPKTTDANGRANFRFALPDEILGKGDVRVKVTFRTPLGRDEIVARQVPVVGNKIHIEFFPESGDNLVAGVPCKVYVRATTPAGVPVDVRGVVTDGRRELARVESLTDGDQPGANRGLASFTYTPENGKRAWLKLESPAGAYAPLMQEVPVSNATVALLGGSAATATRTGFPLPMPRPEGVVMTVLDPVTAPGEPIRVRIHSVGERRHLVVGAYTRGKPGDTQKVTVDPEMPQVVKLMAGADPRGGVVRVTVFEEVDAKDKKGDKGEDAQTELKPVAERLVFRKPGEVLKIACAAVPANVPGPVVPVAPAAAPAAPPPGALGMQAAGAPTFAANSAVKLALSATDEKGNPVAAILWGAAVNTGAAPGPKDRLVPTHFLLAGEVKGPDDLEHADFLLTDHPKAAEALDLLLGTQGWRRFAEQVPPPDEIRAKPAAAVNADAAHHQRQTGTSVTWTEPAPLRDNRKLNEKFGPRYEAAVQAVARAKAGLEATRAAVANPLPVRTAERAAREARSAADEQTARAASAREPVRKFRANAWYGAVGLVALALCCGAVAVARPTDRFPLGFSTLGSAGLAVFLVLAAGWGESRVAAKDSSAPAEVAKAGAPPERDAPADRGPTATATGVAPPMPGRAKSALPEFKIAGDTAKGAINGSGGYTGLGAGVGAEAPAMFGPPKVLAGGGPGAAPPGLPRPDPVRPTSEPKGPPPPAPAGLSPPPAPVGPAPSPGPAGIGWDPKRENGVSRADILASQPALQALTGGADRAAGYAEEVKKAAEHAASYATDRTNVLAAPLDEFFQQRERAKKGAGPTQPGSDKYQLLEKFAGQQIRGSVTAVPPLVVREYAAPRPTTNESPDDAQDTVLWQPVIVLPADGKTTLDFHLGPARGGYQVMIAGHTADGRLGAVRGVILTTPSKASGPRPPVPAGSGAPGGSVPPVVPVAPAKAPLP